MATKRVIITKFTDDVYSAVLSGLTGIDKKDDIEIFINSPGGSLHVGLALYDLFKAIPNKVTTVINGLGASAGFLLSQVGDYRYASKSSCLMHHGSTSGMVNDRIERDEIALKEIQRLNKVYYGHITRRSELTPTQLKNMALEAQGDLYLSPNKAKKLGFIDKVGLPKISLTEEVNQNENPTEGLQIMTLEDLMGGMGQGEAPEEESKKIKSKKKTKLRRVS